MKGLLAHSCPTYLTPALLTSTIYLLVCQDPRSTPGDLVCKRPIPWLHPDHWLALQSWGTCCQLSNSLCPILTHHHSCNIHTLKLTTFIDCCSNFQFYIYIIKSLQKSYFNITHPNFLVMSPSANTYYCVLVPLYFRSDHCYVTIVLSPEQL